ncbi:hypothetical protein PoB_005198600 [Plakobranchus ocellatus]|uniref:Uncharacterized protein n=1 Tax=Plakobranchus ocellatus TaxID=259542 RepID=A0AAV4BQG7_9GAST|nr:hypothetical protein PoB_005198600 [Plakobranchus ocellatus]
MTAGCPAGWAGMRVDDILWRQDRSVMRVTPNWLLTFLQRIMQEARDQAQAPNFGLKDGLYLPGDIRLMPLGYLKLSEE